MLEYLCYNRYVIKTSGGKMNIRQRRAWRRQTAAKALSFLDDTVTAVIVILALAALAYFIKSL